jgi:hypothetical protein
VIFNFHGYPWLIHRLAYRRTNHANMHVRGYKEKGSINTPLELAIENEIDRFSLAIDVINRVPRCWWPAPTSRRSCATCRSSAATTRTSTGSTCRRRMPGRGRTSGPSQVRWVAGLHRLRRGLRHADPGYGVPT